MSLSEALSTTAVDTVSEFSKVKNLPKVPTWRLERDSNPRPSGRKASTLPMRHHGQQFNNEILEHNRGCNREYTMNRMNAIDWLPIGPSSRVYNSDRCRAVISRFPRSHFPLHFNRASFGAFSHQLNFYADDFSRNCILDRGTSYDIICPRRAVNQQSGHRIPLVQGSHLTYYL